MTTPLQESQNTKAKDTLLTHLTAQERAQAMERFEVLRPFLEQHVELPRIAHQHQLPLRTL